MIEIKLKDIQVGKKYYIHQLGDEDIPACPSVKYTVIYRDCHPCGDYDYTFDIIRCSVPEIIHEDNQLSISIEEDRWGLYNYYLPTKNDIYNKKIVNPLLVRGYYWRSKF